MKREVKRRTKKGIGALLLAAMLVSTTVQAEEIVDTQEKQGEGVVSENDTETKTENTISDKKEDIITQPVLPEENTKQKSNKEIIQTANSKLPTVTQTKIVWDGGVLRIPVDLGDYSGSSELRVALKVSSGKETTSFSASLEDTEVVVPFKYDFYDVCGEVPFLGKAGDYDAKLEFLDKQYNKLAEATFTLNVPTDSTLWNVKAEMLKFDGSEDITFSFTNGTNYCELESITAVQVFVNKDATFNAPDLTQGFSYDMKAGKLTLDKEAVKAALRYSQQKLSEVKAELPDSAYINVCVRTSKGIDVYRFNTIKGVTTLTDGAWSIDISNVDLTATNPEPTETANSEFKGSDSYMLTVSSESVSKIEKSALAYIQKYYAEQLKSLGDDYTVVSRLNLSAQAVSDVTQSIKNSFSENLDGKTVGQYYEISISADVMKDGKVVAGLSNIPIPQLEEKITLNLQIPEAVRKAGRAYQMLHYKGGTVEKLSSSTKDNTISFQTDSFSPYALVYSDRANTNTSTAVVSNTPKTGDASNIMLYLVMAAVAFVVFASVLVMRKRRD